MRSLALAVAMLFIPVSVFAAFIGDPTYRAGFSGIDYWFAGTAGYYPYDLPPTGTAIRPGSSQPRPAVPQRAGS